MDALATDSAHRLVVDLVPRSTANCLDLGVRWVGRNLESVLRATLPFALVAALASGLLVEVYDFDLRVVLPVLAVVTWPLGLLWGQRVAAQVFDRKRPSYLFRRDLGPALVDRFTEWIGPLLMVHAMWRLEVSPHGWLFLLGLGLHLVVMPWLGLVGSFVAEDGVLDRKGSGRSRARTRELVHRERSELFVRWHWGAAYGLLLVGVLVVGLETLLQGLLQWSPVLGRGADIPVWFDGPGDAVAIVVHSPWAAGVVAFVGTLVYPVIRIAWTFGYVDLRIRRDLWDLEQRCRDEARLLGGVQ